MINHNLYIVFYHHFPVLVHHTIGSFPHVEIVINKTICGLGLPTSEPTPESSDVAIDPYEAMDLHSHIP
jgi:hypothetical protein